MLALKETVIAQALQLSEEDGLDIIERLAESLSEAANVAAAWDREIDRRLDDAAAGLSKFSSWEEARRLIAGEADASND